MSLPVLVGHLVERGLYDGLGTLVGCSAMHERQMTELNHRKKIALLFFFFAKRDVAAIVHGSLLSYLWEHSTS